MKFSYQKGKSNLKYRDEADEFNLHFRLRSLDTKLLIGDYLSHARVELVRLTQKDVAKETGVSIRNIRYIETGYGVSMDIIMRVYLYYVSVGVLSGETQGHFSDLCRGIWMSKM